MQQAKEKIRESGERGIHESEEKLAVDLHNVEEEERRHSQLSHRFLQTDRCFNALAHGVRFTPLSTRRPRSFLSNSPQGGVNGTRNEKLQSSSVAFQPSIDASQLSIYLSTYLPGAHWTSY